MTGLSRADLAARRLRVLHRGRSRNPDVFLVQSERGPVVVKDFAPRAAWVRLLLGPWLNAREMRAYRALDGLDAVPRLLGRIDRLAFAVEYRPGRRMSRRLAGQVPADFVSRLEAAVAAMHARGVVHLDLRHRSNVLVDAAGRPVLIDFASALCLRPERRPDRWLLRWLSRWDRDAVAKWRERLVPQAGVPEPRVGAPEPASAGASGTEGASASGRRASRPT